MDSILYVFNGTFVITERAALELVDSSSHACTWAEAYALCPISDPCVAVTISFLHISDLAWKYAGTHSASLWTLLCSSSHRSNCAFARSQCTLSTVLNMSYKHMSLDLCAYDHLQLSIHVPSSSIVLPKLQIHDGWVLHWSTWAEPRIWVATCRSSGWSLGRSESFFKAFQSLQHASLAILYTHACSWMVMSTPWTVFHARVFILWVLACRTCVRNSADLNPRQGVSYEWHHWLEQNVA